ncbi:MAG: hypothetical protein R3B91_11865 [Planctomycetaceae bacterium]
MFQTQSSHCGRYEPIINRRELLRKAGGGMGMLALADHGPAIVRGQRA